MQYIYEIKFHCNNTFQVVSLVKTIIIQLILVIDKINNKHLQLLKE